jgi:type IV secretory pathway TrbL component
MDRVDNALEKKDGTMIAQPGEPLYQEGIDAFLEGDDAFKAWAQKVNAKATEMGLGADTFTPSNGLRNKATVGSKAGTFSSEGKSEPGEGKNAAQEKNAEDLSTGGGGSDRRIKDLKKIISDARMKTQKDRTRKLVSSIYRRF